MTSHEWIVLLFSNFSLAFHKTLKNLILILFIGLSLSACTSFSIADQPKSSGSITLDGEGNIGQTFVARFDGLAAIGLSIQTSSSSEGDLKLVVHSSPQDNQNLREAVLPLSAVNNNGFTYFYFPPLVSSNNQSYYFNLKFIGNGQVFVGISDGNTYINGALYINNEPQNAQLNFQSIYSRKLMAIGLVKEVLNWLVLTLAGLFLFIVPGWAILSWLFPTWDIQSFWVKFGLSAGFSLVVYPLLILWTNVFNLHLGVIYAWLPPILGFLLILFRNRYRLNQGRGLFKKSISPSPADISLVFIIICLVLTRFWVIRGLDVPLWGDSYQHTMMAQLMVDNKGLFSSWQPYAELESFTYHFGFHSLVAAFSWLTNLPVIGSLLYVGQFLNILAILALYPLSRRLTKNPWAGVFTVLLAGLLFSMPMFYLNWGRYTQLTGLIILPSFAFVAWNLLRKNRFSIPIFLLSFLVTAGLFLTHVRVWIFAIIFVVAYFFIYFVPKKLGSILIRTITLFTASIILTLPWIINIFNGKLPAIAASQITSLPSKLPAGTPEANTIGNLLNYLPVWAWILLPLAIGWGLWKREKGIGLVSLWWFLILLAANPQWLNLPGSGVITSFAVMISLYIPASLILGTAASWLVEAVEIKIIIHPFSKRRFDRLYRLLIPGILFFAIVGLSIIGTIWRFNDLQIQNFALVVRPDIQASKWIKLNTSPDAKFLVNSFFAYGGSAIVGSDGGWWLPLLANRQTSLPPLTYASEKGPRPDYRQWTNDLTELIENKGIDDPEVLTELSNRGIDYVYIGERQGLVNTNTPLINLTDILSNPNFAPVYHQDRVWIFKINSVQ
jgi:hypothetical protein